MLQAGEVRDTGCVFRGRHSVRHQVWVPEELGISLQTAKMYMFRLRKAADRLHRAGKIPGRGKDIFWTQGRPGGFVHVLRANVVFVDIE
jgi:hypothetical protein